MAVITVEKALVYANVGGDIDDWQREGTPEEKAIIEFGDWSVMEMIVDELTLWKARFSSRTQDNPGPQSFTVMSEDEIRRAKQQAERHHFSEIADEWYEEVFSILSPLAS
jgi:hypothetical protein